MNNEFLELMLDYISAVIYMALWGFEYCLDNGCADGLNFQEFLMLDEIV